MGFFPSVMSWKAGYLYIPLCQRSSCSVQSWQNVCVCGFVNVAGKLRHKWQATAETNFTKPRTKKFSQLCILRCNSSDWAEAECEPSCGPTAPLVVLPRRVQWGSQWPERECSQTKIASAPHKTWMLRSCLLPAVVQSVNFAEMGIIHRERKYVEDF